MAREENDRELLSKLLDNYESLLTQKQRDAFNDMHTRLKGDGKRSLSMKQRRWAEKILEEFEPTYNNAYSSGTIPRGHEVEVPVVLRRENLPMKPPGRR